VVVGVEEFRVECHHNFVELLLVLDFFERR
jgi:hypothetical protein